MRLLKETIEIRANSEVEAQNVINEYRNNADEKGYSVSAAGYTYKAKKSKGEVIDEAWVCKIVLTFGTIWEE